MTTSNYKELIKAEYIKCAKDPVYFMKKYCQIQHPQKGKILFQLYDFQEKALKTIAENDYSIILKSRQLGISTLTAGYSLWLMIFHSDKNVLVIATKQEVAKNLVLKVRTMHDLLPSWLKSQCIEDNKLSLRFKNGSQIKAVSAAADAGRSEALSLLIIDEAAFIDYIDEIWASSQQTLANGGRAIILSTPNGVGNFFHKTWVGAETSENGFTPILLPWTVHPDRNQEWRDKQTRLLGEKMAAQECFSGNVRIMTPNGWVPIEKLNVGDYVISHTGKFQKIIRKYKSEKSNLYKVRSSKNYKKECYVTENHPIAIKNNELIEYVDVKDYTKDMCGILSPSIVGHDKNCIIDLYELVTPKFFKKKLTDNGDYFYINDRKHKIVHKRYLEVNYEFGYLIGLYLAEGSGSRLRKTFSFNARTEYDKWPIEVQQICFNLFGKTNTHIRVQTESSGHLSVSSEIISNVIDKFVEGNAAWNKRLTLYAYAVSSKDFWKGILDGVFVGDGCSTATANHAISLTSSELIYDLLYASYVSGIFGISTSINEDNKTKTIKSSFRVGMSDVHEKSSIRFLNTRNSTVDKISLNTNLILSDDVKWGFDKINPSITKTVYNLEVENDNTYVTEFGLVHNCDCDFISSGHTVVDGSIIQWYSDTFVVNPIEKRGIDSNLWIWEYADFSKNYIVVADVARGDGGDFSTCHVLNVETLEQVAEYKGKLDTKSFGNFLVSLATEYNDAMLVIENANIGWAVIQQAIDRNYTNLYYSYKEDGYLDPSLQIAKGYDLKNKAQMVPGFTMSSRIRPLIISKLEMYFRERLPIIKSKRLIEELFVFIWNGAKAEALSGYNDDLVMALGIAFWTRDYAIKLKNDGLSITKAAIANISKPQSVYTNTGKDNNYWKMNIGNSESEDIKWLL